MTATDIVEENRRTKSEKSDGSGASLHKLVSVASNAVNGQIDAFAKRLVDALMQLSDVSTDSKQASLTFNSSNLLKKNLYAFHFLATGCLQKILKQEIDQIESPAFSTRNKYDDELTLVPYADMDRQLMLSNMSRPLESKHADQLTALRLRVAHILGREEISNNQLPFRPEVMICAMTDAWNEFNPDAESHGLILPLLKEDVFLDLAPVYAAINKELVDQGVLPELADFYNIKKTTGSLPTKQKAEKLNSAALQQLRQLFSPQADMAGAPSLPAGDAMSSFAGVPMIPGLPGVPMIPGLPGMAAPAGMAGAPAFSGMPGGAASGSAAPGYPGTMYATAEGLAGSPNQAMSAPMGSSQLLNFLSSLQNSHALYQASAVPTGAAPLASMLPRVKAAAPQGSLSRVDESTVDLLTKIFDVVFRDQNIPAEIKGLIGFLQVPVLKAALNDKEFFFKEEHPARRLIELLSKTSVEWDQSKGHDDPVYQAIKRNVDRVHQEFDQESTVFANVVSDLEAFLKQEEKVASEALSAPIAKALKQEKWGAATKAAKNEIAIRIGTGEVVAFVETFLENKWVKVLTLAYSIQEEKPKALESAVKTMDDLIWSVKPKITPEERKELITKLPNMLAMLNKWLDLVKLDDAERLQFFAELAECHASIVRAPLEMSPQRRLEIAMEVAKEAAERRLQKKVEQEAQQAEEAPIVEQTVQHIEGLERGMWFEFAAQGEAEAKKVKLSWISPLRSLFIFTTRDKSESFSLSAEELAKALTEERVLVIELDGLVNRALSEALGANDPVMDQQSAA